MFSYYFALGVRQLRRHPMLTALIVLTLAIGVAARVSTFTLVYVMGGNPIPHKSSRLLVPLVDVGGVEGYVPGPKTGGTQLTYTDTMNFLRSGQGVRRSAIYTVASALQVPGHETYPKFVIGQAVNADFFPMFDVPFLYGSAWTAEAEQRADDVVVLGYDMAQKLFGATNPVGQALRIGDKELRVVGVLNPWKPTLRYYRIEGPDPFGDPDDYFLPFPTAVRYQWSNNGNTNCEKGQSAPGYEAFLASDCQWTQFWFETNTFGDRSAIQNWLDGYVAEQQKLGRLLRPKKAELFDVMEWMERMEVIDNDTRLTEWLAMGFLALCMVNAVGLILAKFSTRADEVGVRRALGASRLEIFFQFMMETTVLGLAGGLVGIVLSMGSLWLIGRQSEATAAVAHMDWAMLLYTFFVSLVATLIAGLLPTWRACHVKPAVQLKSQ